MTFSPFITILKSQTSFKTRSKKRIKLIKFSFGNSIIFFTKEISFELKYYRIILKYFKKNIKFKKKTKKLFLKRQGWLPLQVNFPLTKKSQNSRMGKGKGDFSRWVMRCKNGNTLIETKNISMYKLNKLMIVLKKKINCKLALQMKFNFISTKISLKNSIFWYI